MRGILAIVATAALAIGAAFAVAPTTTVIVELAADPGAVYKARLEQNGQSVSDAQLEQYRAQLVAQQNALLTRLTAAAIPYQVATAEIRKPGGITAATIEHRYTLVYNGIALVVSINDVARLRSIAGVKDVHRARELSVDLDHSVPFTHAPQVYGGYPELTPFDHENEGFEGQGMVISVIDTGIEWHHEMFGNDPTPPRLGVLPSSALVPTNPKVIYYLPMSDLAVEDGFGHGTHVASTAAGYLGFTAGADGIPLNADDVPLHGMAPQARLMAYGVCSNVVSTPGSLLGVGPGGCLNVNTLTALEDSMSHKTKTGFPKPVPQVINMSLGGNYGTPDDESAAAASNAALLGAIVVAAAGNAGDVPTIISSPSVGRHVISVAAGTDPGSSSNWFVDVLDPGSFPASVTGAQTPAVQYPQAPGQRSGISTIPVSGTPSPAATSIAQYYVYVANGTTAAQYPAAVSGRIALIDVGGASGVYAETINNAAIAGAVAALLIDDGDGATGVVGQIPVALLHPVEAQYLLGLIGPSPADGAISPMPIRVNPAPAHFESAIAGFSSRGPVPGFGQVKPDVTAPGVQIVAAIPPASVIGAVFALPDGLNYAPLDGTSMATPHVAGAAALVKQANPSWTPDMVRTALINTATQMRDAQDQQQPYGPGSPSLHAQGGGYIDVRAAAQAKALMGVRGDGIDAPSILGSHSFGVVPSINTRCVSQQTVPVEIRDLRGTGGTYTLAVHGIRGADREGVELTLSTAQVSVPANGHASFDTGVRFDGDRIRDDDFLELQWFVVATRSDSTERLSMPLYYRAVPSVPAGNGGENTQTQLYSGTLGLGSQDAGQGQQYVDVPVQVAPGTFRLEGLLEGDTVTNVAYPDLDLELYDPSGALLESSANPGSVESVDVEITTGGTYVFRVVNFLNHGAGYDLTVTMHATPGIAPATLDPIQADRMGEEGPTDLDGNILLSWHGSGQETAYEVQSRLDGGEWTTRKVLPASASSFKFQNLGNGIYDFRILSRFPGQICTFVAAPSEVRSVAVVRSRRGILTPSVQ